MNNLVRLPKNLNILKDPKAFKNYCLNPLGLTAQKTSHFPKEQKVEKFCNIEMLIHRGEKPLENNTVVLKCDPNLAKPEIKQYLTKLYGLEINKVNTVRYTGKLKNSILRKTFKTKDFKKVYAVLKTEVEPFYQKIETM
ncbi:hypothetical protein ABPG74_022934 [Tetrahymena malaccensis]